MNAWTPLQRELLAVEDVLTQPELLRRQVAGRTLLYVGGNRRVHPVLCEWVRAQQGDLRLHTGVVDLHDPRQHFARALHGVHRVYYPQDRTAEAAARAIAVLAACHGASCHAVRTASVASFLAALVGTAAPEGGVTPEGAGAWAEGGARPGLRCLRHG